MPLIDRNIVITPNRGGATEPTIRFTGADVTNSATITLRVLNSATTGILSFEGTSGQLFSITDSLSGTLFSVNNISGLPSIEVLSTGEIRLAQYGGFANVLATTSATSTATGALRVAGGVGIAGDVWIGGSLNITGSIALPYPLVFNDISAQADGRKAAFPLFNNQTAVTGIVDNKDVQVTVNGQIIAPYVTETGLPWINTVNSIKGFRVLTTGTTQNWLVIYNAPDIGSQITVTQINKSGTKQTRSYPYSASVIALGD